MSEFETLFVSLCFLRDTYAAKANVESNNSFSGFYRGRAGAYDVACSALKEAIELEKESWKKR